MNAMNPIDVIISNMPQRIRPVLSRARPAFENEASEIVIRSQRPLCIGCPDKRYYLLNNSCLTDDPAAEGAVHTSAQELGESLMSLCNYSVYSKQEELNRGYISAAQGVRVGLCGEAVMRDDQIINIRNISTLSFRLPREVIGCAEELLSLIDPMRGVLVCGPPCSGKTTLIRDMARLLSYRYRVSVIDERGELSAARGGVCGYDMGLCDIYVNISKACGVLNSLRSLSPDIIICDEPGDREDAESVAAALRCGAAFIATLHACNVEDLHQRPVARALLSTGAFRYIVFLSGRAKPGRASRVYEWG